MARNLSATAARFDLPNAINRVAFGGERVVIERRGKAIAALVSIEDLALIRRIEDEIDMEAVRAAKAAPGPTVSLEEAFAFLDAE